VLFSQDTVANFINQNFEPAWQSVRPVPIVRIDFGDGRVLTRTLHGNILTAVCTADGRMLDALPGIYTVGAYLDRLNQLRLLALYVAQRPAQDREALVKDYHKRQAEALAKNQPPEEFVATKMMAAVSKARIEKPLELVFLRPAGSPPAPLAVPPPSASLPKGADVPTVGGSDVGRWKELAEDTKLNETTRRRQVHELLAGAGLVRPEKVTRPIYKDVLHADLDDPYLGLGKVLFNNYPFAREDGVAKP